VERELELNLVITGETTVRAGADSYNVRAGEALWLLPGHLHGLTRVSADFSMWVLMFRAELVEELRRFDASLGSGHAAEHICLQTAEFGALLHRCFAAFCQQANLPQFNASAAEVLLSAWQARGATRTGAPEVHPAAARAARVLATTDRPPALRGLARQVGLSEYQLSRSFHRGFGVTLSFFSGFERVQRYVRLAHERPRRNMLASALAAGFGSYSQFFRTFRAVTGWVPSEHERLIELGSVPPLDFWDQPGSL